MELIHTSPAAITKITSEGRFGEFLFFSGKQYVMTAGAFVAYSLELNESDVIDADQLFYHADAGKLDGLVAELSARLGVDADVAEELMSESIDTHAIDSIETEDAADASWDVQLFTARAAKLLGFRAVRVQDEQGTAYLVDMLGRETELRAI